MDDQALTPDEIARLSNDQLTYPEVGATRGELPPGYHHVSREALLGTGSRQLTGTGSRETDTFEAATKALFRWQLQRRAGVRVVPSSPVVTEGALAVLLLGIGPAALRAPVRVVYVVDEPHVKGFAYGTLPGHPESGEEAFLVERRPDASVVCRVVAFSRPVTWLARLGGPATIVTQRWVTGRYLRSLRG